MNDQNRKNQPTRKRSGTWREGRKKTHTWRRGRGSCLIISASSRYTQTVVGSGSDGAAVTGEATVRGYTQHPIKEKREKETRKHGRVATFMKGEIANKRV